MNELFSDSVVSIDGRSYRVDKPWGHEFVYALTDRYCGKILFVRAGERLSLQLHRRKDETILLYAGRAEIEIRDGRQARVLDLAPGGDALRIRPGTIHRIRAIADSVFLEVSTPDLDDVVRLEDQYDRSVLPLERCKIAEASSPEGASAPSAPEEVSGRVSEA